MAKRKPQGQPRKRKVAPPTDTINHNGLTIKQQLFVDHYIVCMNGTEAARLAGYGGDDAALAAAASRLLRNVNILRHVDARLNQYAMSANEVLIHLTDIARGDITDALNSLGGIDPLEAKRRGKSHIIKAFKTKVTTITEKGGDEREIVEDEIEMYDRLDALKTLAKFHALLVDRVRNEDWRTDIIQLLKEGRVTPAQLEAEIGYELATDIIASVVISGATSGES